jgi:hypothetical protein
MFITRKSSSKMKTLFLSLIILFFTADAPPLGFFSGGGCGGSGQYVTSTSSMANVAATNTLGNVASITLPPGDWDVTGVIHLVAGAVPAVATPQAQGRISARGAI